MGHSLKSGEILQSVVIEARENPIEIVDSDEMQLKDGSNENWVHNWHTAMHDKKTRKT